MFSKLIERLKKSEEFKRFKNVHKNAYLASFFFIDDNWEIDYYDKENGRVTTFILKDKVEVKEDKIFKKEGRIEELKIEDVRIDLDSVLKKINNDKKKIIIVQMLNGKAVWNISYLDGLDLVNIKIDAGNGEVVSEEKGSLIKFKKK